MLLQQSDEETTLWTVMQARWKTPSTSKAIHRCINTKAQIITGEENAVRFSKPKRNGKISSDSDLEEDEPQIVMELDDADDSSVDHVPDENAPKEELFHMPKLDDSTAGKF